MMSELSRNLKNHEESGLSNRKQFDFPDFYLVVIVLENKFPQIQSMKAVLREKEVSYVIRKSIFCVYNELGPGLLESIYEAALCVELTRSGLEVRRQVGIPVFYKGENLNLGFRLDVLVEELVWFSVPGLPV